MSRPNQKLCVHLASINLKPRFSVGRYLRAVVLIIETERDHRELNQLTLELQRIADSFVFIVMHQYWPILTPSSLADSYTNTDVPSAVNPHDMAVVTVILKLRQRQTGSA